MSGRHIILLGILACCGLMSVHDGQQQIEHCYRLGTLEKNLREIRADIQLCKIKHRALQSPKAVVEKAGALHLSVKPVGTDCDAVAQATPQSGYGAPHLAPVQVPQIPSIRNAPGTHGQ
jgi:hypothetical protein